MTPYFVRHNDSHLRRKLTPGRSYETLAWMHWRCLTFRVILGFRKNLLGRLSLGHRTRYRNVIFFFFFFFLERGWRDWGNVWHVCSVIGMDWVCRAWPWEANPVLAIDREKAFFFPSNLSLPFFLTIYINICFLTSNIRIISITSSYRVLSARKIPKTKRELERS